MSHTSSIKSVKIVSVDALRAAVFELASSGIKCSLIENATPRAYFKDQQGMGKANYVLRLDNANYDVGFYRQEDGSYEPRTDFFGGTVAREIGGQATSSEKQEQAQMGKLFQAYAIHATIEQARKRGQAVMRHTDPKTGKVMLTVTGPGI